MIPEALKLLLRKSLDDTRISRAEKAELILQVEQADLTPHEISVVRSHAFELARAAQNQQSAADVLDWLEEVCKVLQRQPSTRTTEIAEAWFGPGEKCPQRIRSLLNEARQSVDICVFTITDDRLTSAVLDAHRRGVRIRIVTDNDKAADLGSDADRFLEAGVPLRIDRSPYHMHHKFAVFDSTLLLNGSYNWTRGAAADNEENFMVLNHRKLVTQFNDAFEELWTLLKP
jgi:cardiolipin hydrolase